MGAIVPVVVGLVIVGFEEEGPMGAHDAVDVALQRSVAEEGIGFPGRWMETHGEAFVSEFGSARKVWA